MDENKSITFQEIQSAAANLRNIETFPQNYDLILEYLSGSYNTSLNETDNQNFNGAYGFISAGLQTCALTLPILKILSDECTDAEIKTSLNENILAVENFKLKFEAANNFTTGIFHYSNRNPGLANQFFSESEKIFKELFNKTRDSYFVILSENSKNYKHMSEGLEKFITGDLIDARKNYQMAKIGFEDTINKLNRENSDEMNYMKIKTEFICRECTNILYLSNAQYYFRSKNFKLAVENYDKLLDLLKQITEEYKAAEADQTDESTSNIDSAINFYEGNYFYNFGFRNIAKGHEFQEFEKWEEALECFENTRTAWTKATVFLLKSNIPQAVTLQEFISQNEFTIDQYISACIKDREQKQKISELENKVKQQQEELFNMLKPAGVTFNNIQDINNTVEQNVQVVQKIENKTRESIKDLLELMKSVPLDESVKKEIETEGKELVESKEKGVKFLDKAKSFTEKVSGIVKNVGEIATPLIPVVKALAMMLV
ncbi:MAG: hypothetical protein IPM38_09800 [Ignavibacteria bacterium]|nr:hypothetical protein [Ignavibacteria bacterium]